jgi:hypothetical protein
MCIQRCDGCGATGAQADHPLDILDDLTVYVRRTPRDALRCWLPPPPAYVFHIQIGVEEALKMALGKSRVGMRATDIAILADVIHVDTIQEFCRKSQLPLLALLPASCLLYPLEKPYRLFTPPRAKRTLGIPRHLRKARTRAPRRQPHL